MIKEKAMKKIMGITIGAILLFSLLFIGGTPESGWAAPTKTTSIEVVDDWQLVAAGTMVVGNAFDVSGSYESAIYLEVALTDAQAQAGVDIIIEVSYADDDWVELTAFKGTAETPSTTTINDATANAGDTTIVLTADQADFNVKGRKWFIVDGTVANSESVKTISNSTVTYTLAQDLIRSHANSLNVWDRVDDWFISLPNQPSFARVLINNTDADADVHFTSRGSRTTAL